MTLEVSYPCAGASKEPRPMKAQEIWSVADQVRRQLTRRPQVASHAPRPMSTGCMRSASSRGG